MQNLNFTYSLFSSKNLVIDLGNYQIKAGVNQEEQPSNIFNSIFAVNHTQDQNTISKSKIKIGITLENENNLSNITTPIFIQG